MTKLNSPKNPPIFKEDSDESRRILGVDRDGNCYTVRYTKVVPDQPSFYRDGRSGYIWMSNLAGWCELPKFDIKPIV